MRVDGRPNVMTCERSATPDATLSTQNVVGSAAMDLLRVTDWFFPNGMNHHEMFTQFAPLNKVMQKVARRVAGIGRLPDAVSTAPEVEHRKVDVLVIGAGPAGLAASTSLARAERSVSLVDSALLPGGTLRLFPSLPTGEVSHQGPDDLLAELAADANSAGVELELGASALTVHREERVCWISTEGRSLAVKARAIVLATGCREAMPIVEGIDLPRVLTGQAAAVLLNAGVLPGRNIVVVGSGNWAEAIAATSVAAGATVKRLATAALQGLRGGSSVEVVATAAGERLACDAVVVVGVPTAAYELAGQLDASVPFRDDGFVVATDAHGAAIHSALPLWAVGSVRGVRGLAEARADGIFVAESVNQWLAHEDVQGATP